nr:MAG TPA: hypothetical protein [Caudoviricetes sp.]DAT73157.1 MAG TPA: hypothetical protein [Caudoviricetes sp.]
MQLRCIIGSFTFIPLLFWCNMTVFNTAFL